MGVLVSPSQTPLPPLSPSHMQGCPYALASNALFHALNLDWSSISHMVIYLIQCYSLKSSHPLFLIVFLYFFALIAEEGFLISPCCSLNSAFKWVYLSFSPLPLASLLTAFCKASSVNHFAFLHFFFLGMVLITISCKMSQTTQLLKRTHLNQF